MKYLVTLMFQLCLNYLKANGEDTRLVYDNPQGTLSYQGVVRYSRKLPVPKKPNDR